jgi:spermidine synthase
MAAAEIRTALAAGTYALVFCTGASAMMYQVAWQRYLARLLGGDAAATAVVLAAFLGGLSLGYLVFGRLASRTKRPFRAYGLAEAFIGLWGLGFPWLFTAVESASAGLALTPPLGLALQGFCLAAALVGPPAACMGATVPLLTQALSRDLESSGKVHARLYGVNTAGAFLGTAAAGYLAVPELGLPGTLRLAACLNLPAACFFCMVREPARVAAGAPSRPLPARDEPGWSAQAAALMALAFVNGFQSMGLENVLTRFVALAAGGSAYAFTMVVGVFVLAIAAGAFLAGMFARLGTRAVWINQALVAALLFALYPTLDTWPYWAHRLRLPFSPSPEGFWGYQAAGFASLAALAGPPALLIGAAVPLVFNSLRGDLACVGMLSGRILFANTLGNLSGSLAAGLMLHPLLDNGRIFLLCAWLGLCGTWLAANGFSRRVRLAAGAAVLCAAALIPLEPWHDPGRFVMGTFKFRGPLPFSHEQPDAFYRELYADARTLYAQDGPECSAAVVRSPRLPWSDKPPLSIFINGKSDSSTVADMATLKLLAHIPALLAPSRDRILVVGLGSGVTSGELALYRDAGTIDTAEISSSVIEALPLFSDFTGRVHENPRHRVLQGDAFRILARSGERFGLIVSEPSNPWVLGVDMLFSREFYELAKGHLAPGGLFAQWMHIHDASAAELGCVLETLRSVFGHVRVFMSQANDLVLLAGEDDIPARALADAAGAWKENPDVAASLGQAGLGSMEAVLAREIGVPALTGPVETLDRPVLHYMAGKSFFMGARVSGGDLLSGGDPAERGLLERHASARPEGPPGDEEAAAIIGSAVDRSGYEAEPLPMAGMLRSRLERLVR